MVSLAAGLSWAVIAVAVLLYLAAVAGVLADAATPPLDVGATSVLVTGLANAVPTPAYRGPPPARGAKPPGSSMALVHGRSVAECPLAGPRPVGRPRPWPTSAFARPRDVTP